MPKPLAQKYYYGPIDARPTVIKDQGRWVAWCSEHWFFSKHPTWESAYAHARGHSQAAHRTSTGDQMAPAEHTGRTRAETRLDRARQALIATGNAVNAARAEYAAALAAIDRLNQQDNK